LQIVEGQTRQWPKEKATASSFIYMTTTKARYPMIELFLLNINFSYILGVNMPFTNHIGMPLTRVWGVPIRRRIHCHRKKMIW